MSDRILFSIGEALIDMIPSRVGCSFDEVPAFSPRVGGAPANVCAAVARLGGRSALLSQLGDDPFGHKIARELEQHQVTLLKDVAMFDQMYELNLKYYKELTMYILAGKKKLEDMRAGELPALKAKAEQSGAQEDAQAYNDMVQMCERFEKKIYDLELTRAISLQMAPQIRLIQSNDIAMSEKIQSTLVNTIPLWKSQMVIAIGLDHATDAAKAQRAVSDMTNELLKKNAEALKVASVETAKESERGIVDIETLKSTNQTLMTTLDEVMKIQEEGRARRQSAEEDLQRIENEMRDKLLEMSRASHT